MSRRLKVMTILGTRPEIIRLSAVIALLDEVTTHVLVHTGQNHDPELSTVFFEELQVRPPDYRFSAGSGSLARRIGDILVSAETALNVEQPDAVLVLGDTNSAFAAIIAKRMQIPVYHMEAGNRSFDDNVPEELNRRIVDHTADFNLVYSERARQHLLAEGVPARRIYFTGSPLCEVLDRHRPAIEACGVLEEHGLKAGGFLLVSVHRQENVDDPERLKAVLSCLNHLAEQHDCPVIVSTHPRTRARLDALTGAGLDTRLRFLKPFGFIAYNKLQRSARCVVSDSGSIAEEAAILGFPAVSLRDSTERPEALDAGTVLLTGLIPQTVAAAVHMQISRHQIGKPSTPPEYHIPDTSERVASLILGTAQLSNVWDGVRPLRG